MKNIKQSFVIYFLESVEHPGMFYGEVKDDWNHQRALYPFVRDGRPGGMPFGRLASAEKALSGSQNLLKESGFSDTLKITAFDYSFDVDITEVDGNFCSKGETVVNSLTWIRKKQS